MGIGDKVTFTGELPWRDALKQFQDADVLVHPSLHDSGGFVLLEAMEMAKPVICLKLGGPGVYVNADCGFAVKAGTVDQAIADIASAMQRLAEDKALSQRLGEAGRHRARHRIHLEAKRGRHRTPLSRGGQEIDASAANIPFIRGS